jgi:FkbM family methyltransferase
MHLHDSEWAISTVELAGRYRFGIACGTDATPETDPVAVCYRAGSLMHLGELADVLLAALRPGDRVLDLGAHIGGFALSAAAIGCEVIAVEASPRNAELLRRSVAHNRFANCHVVEAAVADKPGSVAFTVRGPYGQVGVPVEGQPMVTVPAVRADDVLREHGWDRVRFVKLDVEGFEIPALHGLERTLRRKDAPMIYFESNTHTLAMYGQTDADLKGTLRRYGYTIYDVGPRTLRRADRDGQRDVVTDYLAAKRLPKELQAWLPVRRPSLAFRAVRKLLRMARVRR